MSPRMYLKGFVHAYVHLDVGLEENGEKYSHSSCLEKPIQLGSNQLNI